MKKIKPFIISAVVLLCAAIAVFVFEPHLRPSFSNENRQTYIMGTSYSVKVYGWISPDWDDLYQNALSKAAAYDHRDPQSALYALNNGAIVTSVPHLAKIIKNSLKIAQESNGAFDPTLLPLLKLWGFDTGGKLPAKKEIAAALAKTGYKKVKLNGTDTLQLPEGVQLDLGGIAKGTVVDEISLYLDKQGYSSYLIEAGGDIIVKDTKPDGSPWIIIIRAPRIPGIPLNSKEFSPNRLKAVGFVKIGIPNKKLAIVTSGDYERKFIKDGVVYHHILDPQTGYPARAAASVSVIARTCEEADAYATAAFVKGYNDGFIFLENLPHVEGFIINDIGKGYMEMHQTSGFPEIFRNK